MFLYEYGRRLDTIDYVNMGTSNNWHYNDTVTLLTSFEMELKQYFDRPDYEDIYSRLYDRFSNYMSNCMFNKSFEYTDGLKPEDREINHFEGAVGFDTDRAYFNKDMFIDYLSNNNIVMININRLKMFISGEEVPIVPIKIKKTTSLKQNPPNDKVNDINATNNAELYYEDIMSDETIFRLKSLPPHQLKQQVAMLAAEKKKWDASIIAAAKVGLLFYEEGLTRPTKENLFVAEYKKHFDKLPPLPKSTIERIYKHLPDGYRRATDGGKVATEQQDIDPIIKAATFAGSQVVHRESMNLKRLKKSLSIEGYNVPSDDILEKIIAAVKKLDL